MHVTKVHFIQLVLKIKYVEFEDKPNNFYLKTENVNFFTARRLIKELPTKKMKNTKIGRLSAKVANIHCDD